MPTLLDILDIKHPENSYKDREIIPMQGISILPALEDDSVSVRDPNHIEGWEMFGKTAIRKGDWKMIQEPEDDYFSWQTPLEDNYRWQLFNLAEDPSEFYDVSEQYPEKFDEMIEAWNQYKKENGVIIPESVMGF